jgi:hypothetical protein
MLLLSALLLFSPVQDAKPAQAPAPAWSATTIEAAATPANKAVLAKGQAMTLTGEVIDLSCFNQLGKKGEAHKACGAKCVSHGSPAGLLTADGKVYMLMPEQHHPRRDGQVSLSDWAAEKMGTTVTVSGMASTEGGMNTLFMEAPAAKK